MCLSDQVLIMEDCKLTITGDGGQSEAAEERNSKHRKNQILACICTITAGLSVSSGTIRKFHSGSTEE